MIYIAYKDHFSFWLGIIIHIYIYIYLYIYTAIYKNY